MIKATIFAESAESAVVTDWPFSFTSRCWRNGLHHRMKKGKVWLRPAATSIPGPSARLLRDHQFGLAFLPARARECSAVFGALAEFAWRRMPKRVGVLLMLID